MYYYVLYLNTLPLVGRSIKKQEREGKSLAVKLAIPI